MRAVARRNQSQSGGRITAESAEHAEMKINELTETIIAAAIEAWPLRSLRALQ
jgi:hypothetical protein